MQPPSILQKSWEQWMRIVDAFSWLFTRIALSILFFTVFLAYSIILRVINKDPLSRQLEPDAGSYWGKYHTQNDSISDFRRQY